MIDVKAINSFILIQKIKEHKQVKNDLLSLIEKMPQKNIQSNFENIEKTDWNLPNIQNRTYENLFLETVKEYNENVKEFFKAKEYWIKNFWYQQYYNKDYHKWHVHSGSLLSNVYYIELKNNNSTVFYNYLTKETYKFDIEEGDLITFPSMLPHKSDVNNEERKTIISYNADFNYINI